MPAAIVQNRLLTKCETCGKDNPGYGYNVNLRRALNELAANRKDSAKKALRTWYCAEHRKDKR